MAGTWWWAIEHEATDTLQNLFGDHVGQVVRFPKKTERDAWVKAGTAPRGQAGYREALAFRYPRDKQAIRDYLEEIDEK
jgi:hypothetical protein